jgi:hypothetical protein
MALRVLLLALALLSSLTVASHNAPQVGLAPYENSDAYDVYQAVLSTDATAAATSPLVITSETQPAVMCLKPEGASKRLLLPAIIDYNEQNENVHLLQPKFGLKTRYELLTKQEISARFSQRHPGDGRWFELSAVGFNRERTVAVVWVGYWCPGLCGSGTFHVLHKKNGKWEPLEWKGTNCAIAS